MRNISQIAISFCTLLLVQNILAQSSFNFPLAKEVWSTPVRVDSFTFAYGVSMIQSMDTAYLLSKGGDIYSSFRQNDRWSSLKRLNGYINDGSPVRNPVISKDGERLYFSKWGGYGAWDLYCSYWDTTSNDWSFAKNLGDKINAYWGDYYAYELSPDTLYTINDRWAGMGVCIYIKDSLTNDWKIIDSSNYQHPFGAGDIRGLSITADKKKAYFSRYLSASSPIDSLQSQLYITYWDTLENRWGDVYELNINSKGYRIQVSSNWSYWIGGWDELPWISPDGKTLYFSSNRDIARENPNYAAATDIYISHLIIDDHGDTVTAVNENKYIPSNIDFKLLPNYPNPFNPETNLSFELTETENISLVIYDIRGKEIERLIDDQYYQKGVHHIKWRIKKNNDFSSGIYFFRLKSENKSVTIKSIYIK